MTINEAVKVLYGDGFIKHIGVRIEGLGATVIEAQYYNPATMTLIE